MLRFLKIITPVKCVIPSYDGYICIPKEGELYRRRGIGPHHKLGEPWSVNIDRLNGDMLRGLRLLWDT